MSALALLRGGLQGLFYSLRDLKFNFKSFTSDLERIGAFYECQDLEPSSPGGVAYVEAGLGLRGMKLDFKYVECAFVWERGLTKRVLQGRLDAILSRRCFGSRVDLVLGRSGTARGHRWAQWSWCVLSSLCIFRESHSLRRQIISHLSPCEV